MIRMTHPELPDASPAVASEKAFDRIWGPKGWQKVDDDTSETPPAPKAKTAPPTPPAGQSAAPSGQEG